MRPCELVAFHLGRPAWGQPSALRNLGPPCRLRHASGREPSAGPLACVCVPAPTHVCTSVVRAEQRWQCPTSGSETNRMGDTHLSSWQTLQFPTPHEPPGKFQGLMTTVQGSAAARCGDSSSEHSGAPHALPSLGAQGAAQQGGESGRAGPSYSRVPISETAWALANHVIKISTLMSLSENIGS